MSAAAATSSSGLAEADVVVTGEYTTQVVLHNSMETHQAVVQWLGDTLEVHISTQYIWGVRDELATTLGLPADKVRVVCNYMGGGFGSKNAADDYTYIAIELAKRTHRPVRCALTRREENLATGNRNATIQRLTIGARSDGTLTALGGEYVNATGWDGWSSPVEGPMQMLYACDNVKTTTWAAKINQPPMKAFRAPGFVEGTFGLESLLDVLAAKLDIDPLELRRRNHANHDASDGRPYSGKNLLECYRRAEPHWERRHEVRARSTDTVKRGVGMASQIWYGGGGPPSYAWVRVGSDGRAAVVTAMQDIGTGSTHRDGADRRRGARHPARARDGVARRLRPRSVRVDLAPGSSTTPSMGPAVRAAAADARRQIEEIAEQRGTPEAPLAEIVSLLEDAQILGKGGRGPNPTGMQVLTFGVQVAEVAVDIETGEVWVDRIAAVHDVGRVINPLGASSQIEGGIIQGIGHTLSEHRLHDPRTGQILTTTPRRVQAADDRRRAGDRQRADRRARRAADEPRLEGARRAADHPGRRGDRERDPRRDRAPTCASCRSRARRCCARCARRRRGEGEGWSSGRRLASSSTAGRPLHGGTEVVPLLRSGLLQAETLVDIRGVVPRGIHGGSIGAGATLAELECDPEIPARAARGLPARREPAASERRLARRQPPAVDPLLVLAAQLALPAARRRRVLRARGRAPRARDLRERLLRVGASVRCRGGAARARARRCERTAASSPVADLYRVPDRGRPADDDARAGRAAPRRSSSPRREQSVYLKAMERKRWAFPLVGVAAARSGGRQRESRWPGVAPIPWLLDDGFESATPLPRNAYKVEIAQALVKRARAALDGAA